MNISQREAKRLNKRVADLESVEWQRRRSWSADYPGGTRIGTVDCTTFPKTFSAVETARKLQHAVVVVADGAELRFYALPLAGA